MLIVLCRFYASIVKQNLNFFSRNIPRKWWATAPTGLRAFPVSRWRCYSDFEKNLTNEITSCQNQVNTGQEVISSKYNFLSSRRKNLRTAVSRPVHQSSFTQSWRDIQRSLGESERLVAGSCRYYAA
jgi:hypothetical protein